MRKLWYEEVKGSKGGRTTILHGNLTVERGLLTTILCCLLIETRFPHHPPPTPSQPSELFLQDIRYPTHINLTSPYEHSKFHPLIIPHSHAPCHILMKYTHSLNQQVIVFTFIFCSFIILWPNSLINLRSI